MKQNNKKGFTLLELLIVIAIIAILSVILILVLNPAETLRKSRDAQRISDLNTVKTALGLYMTATTTPQLDGTSGTKNAKCIGGGGSETLYWSAAGIADTAPAPFDAMVSTTTTGADGTGWIPVALTTLTGGSPLSNFPLDPTNTYAAAAAITNADLIYRYACDASPLTFEINAKLESTAYTVDDNRLTKDGGDNTSLYEVGTSLTILGSTDDF